MQLEVEIALNFLLSFLYNKLPRRRVNQFGEELEKAIKIKFQDHWYAEQPSKGSAYRCLKTTPPIDPILEWACVEAGIQLADIKENLPDELSIWIDPGEVSYRLSERSPIKIIYSIRQNTLQDFREPIGELDSFSAITTFKDNNDISGNKLPESQVTSLSFNDKFCNNIDSMFLNDDLTKLQTNFNASTTTTTSNVSQQQSSHILENNHGRTTIPQYCHQLPSDHQKLPITTNHGTVKNNKNDNYQQDQCDYDLEFFNNGITDDKLQRSIEQAQSRFSEFGISSLEPVKNHHRQIDSDIYGKQQQFQSQLSSKSSWSSGSSSSGSSVGSTIGSASSNTIQNRIIMKGNILPNQIGLDFDKAATQNSGNNLTGIPMTNKDHNKLHQQNINNNNIFDDNISNSNMYMDQSVNGHGTIKFPTTINDYSNLGANNSQSMNHQNLMRYLRSSNKQPIVASSLYGAQNNCSTQQQSRIISRNDSFSSQNSLGGSSSSGSIISPGSSESAPTKSNRYQPSFVPGGFCCNQQTMFNSNIDSPPISTTKNQPLVFTAAMFAQTKFGSTKLKNQNNNHSHHAGVNGIGNSTSTPFNNTQQHSMLRSSTLSHQNSILNSCQMLPINSSSNFGISSMRSINQHQNLAHNNQHILNQCFQNDNQTTNVLATNKFNISDNLISSDMMQSRLSCFSRSNDPKSKSLASANLLTKNDYDNHKKNDDINAGDNQLLTTNRSVITQQSRLNDINNDNQFNDKSSGHMIERLTKKPMTEVRSALREKTFHDIINESTMMNFAENIQTDSNYTNTSDCNLQGDKKGNATQQLHSILNLAEANKDLSSNNCDDYTSRQSALFDNKVDDGDRVISRQETRQLANEGKPLLGDNLLDLNHANQYELWSTRTSPIVDYSSIVESVVQDRQLESDNSRIDAVSNEESKSSRSSRLSSEGQLQNICMDSLLSEESNYLTSSFYEHEQKNRQNTDQEELSDILMRLVVKQTENTLLSETFLPDIGQPNVNMGSEINYNNNEITDRDFSQDKISNSDRKKTFNYQVKMDMVDTNDEVMKENSNYSNGLPKTARNENDDQISIASSEKNETDGLIEDSRRNDHLEESPLVVLNDKIDGLRWDDRHPVACHNSTINFQYVDVPDYLNTQSADDDNESLLIEDHDKAESIMSSPSQDTEIASANDSVTSANYGSATNQQCKQQTQQQTQQLLLAN